MCRIRLLFDIKPATGAEGQALVSLFKRRVAGFTLPSQANGAAFDGAAEEVAGALRRLPV